MPLQRLLILLPGLLLLALSPAAAERDRDPAARPHEEPGDPYLASPRAEHPRSPAFRIERQDFFAVQVNVDAFGQNIVGDAANEPSLAVDPTDPDRMSIGWRQFDTVASNFRQAGFGYSTDGGLSWTFPGVIEPGVFRSDPVLDSDSAGNIYYNSLTIEGGDYLCDVFGSATGGMSWDAGTDARGGDKQWMTIDKTGGAGDGHIYAFWNRSFTSCWPGFFTRSTDGNESYEECSTIPDDPYWGTLTVAPDGKLYTVGVLGGDFVVTRSSNAQDAGPDVAWDLATPVDLGGSIESFGGPNPGGLLGQACIATIPDDGPLGYAVCVLCSVDPPGGDPLDIRFARSRDGGVTWSAPLRVNDDAGSAWQWFGTMSASPSGRLDAVWLDTRDELGSYLSSLYYAYSEDGGETWSENERLSESFDPHVGWPNQEKLGDYFDMVSDDQGFHLAWAGTFNGEQDVYYGRKTLGATAVGGSPPAALDLLRADANPFGAGTTLRYDIPRAAHVSLKVYDTQGRAVATLVSGERAAGSYEARLDGESLAGGVYFCRLRAGEAEATLKLLRLK